MIIIDAHCHLANLADKLFLPPLLAEAERAGITHYASSALRRKEAAWHQENSLDNVIWSAGIHPNFDECDLDISFIEQLCMQKQLWAIGEIGLDRNGRELAWQEEAFINQLELARAFHLPVVLHLVGHSDMAVKILKQYQLPYLVHGFAGSVEAMHQLAALGAAFTISSRILKADKHKLLAAMVATGSYLFETDITQYYVKPGEANPLLRLNSVISETARLMNMEIAVLLQSQGATASRLGMV